MVSLPISHRLLLKALLCCIVLAIVRVESRGVRFKENDNDVDEAVKLETASLQREMNSLREQIELFEMKHETLQAASEQFKKQSKSAKSKLEDERKRYEILASEKRSLENNFESTVATALAEEKAKFEDAIVAEGIGKELLLVKENEELSKKLRRTENQLSILEDSIEEKMQEDSKRQEKILAFEEKLQAEITNIKKRLSNSEKQADSFEASWRKAVVESETKDDLFQEETSKRLVEASRWEQRIQILNAESQDLFEENKMKEIELLRSKKLHMTLLEKIELSDQLVEEHEAKIEDFVAEIKILSNDLDSTSSQLTKYKQEHASLLDKFENISDLHEDTEIMLKNALVESERNAAKNKDLQNKLVDVKFELETSQNKTKQTIEEKSDITKAYTEALEQLSSKNTVLRNDLVDIKFEIERSENETEILKTEVAEITNAHTKTRKRLESESKKLKTSQTKLTGLQDELKEMTDRFNESEEKLIESLQRIEEEKETNERTQKELLYAELKIENRNKIEDKLSEKNRKLLQMYEEIESAQEMSELKLRESKQQNEKSQDHIDMLQGSILKFEGKVEELMEQLELKVSKNSYLQKSLLEAKFNLEESQSKVIMLELQSTEDSSVDQIVEAFESEKNKLSNRTELLERELHESNSLYADLSREISAVRDHLNETEARSAHFFHMYESMKKENNVLSDDLRVATKKQNDHKLNFTGIELREKSEAFLQCGKELNATRAKNLKLKQDYDGAKEDDRTSLRNLQSASLELHEKNEAFEQCSKDLNETRAMHSKLMEDYNAEKGKTAEVEKQILVEKEDREELKTGRYESELDVPQSENDLVGMASQESTPSEDIETPNDHQVDAKSDTSDSKAPAAANKTESKELQAEQKSTQTENKTVVPVDATSEKINESVSQNSVAEDTPKNKAEPSTGMMSFLKWLDHALYLILRVIVDSARFFLRISTSSTSNLFGFVTPFKPLLKIVSWAFNELRIIHDALVSLFEFEMTFVSSLLSSEKDRTGFAFLIRHSEVIVMIGEAIAALLCIDFVISSFLNPMRTRKRRPKAKTIYVPKTANTSLLRKANNL